MVYRAYYIISITVEETQWDVSTTQSTHRLKTRKGRKKTDQKGLLHTYIMMTLLKCIGGVTNPMKNHGFMILPLLSMSYLYGQNGV